MHRFFLPEQFDVLHSNLKHDAKMYGLDISHPFIGVSMTPGFLVTIFTENYCDVTSLVLHDVPRLLLRLLVDLCYTSNN